MAITVQGSGRCDCAMAQVQQMRTSASRKEDDEWLVSASFGDNG